MGHLAVTIAILEYVLNAPNRQYAHAHEKRDNFAVIKTLHSQIKHID